MTLPDKLVSFFVSDLHGETSRYEKLFKSISWERPAAVFLGGDLLPTENFALSAGARAMREFVQDVLNWGFGNLKHHMEEAYPSVFLILGNDDPRSLEAEILAGESLGLWEYIHNRRAALKEFSIMGYSFVPPTPFLLKDWERYDVSRFLDPGCISPEEGFRTVFVEETEIKHSTIQMDLERLAERDDLTRAIFLFHTPPYQTPLDRVALDGQRIDGVPVDVHVGSLAVKRFIDSRQPLISLHGHIHESPRLTGSWSCKIGRTHSFSAAHDGAELALVRFDPVQPELATRELI